MPSSTYFPFTGIVRDVLATCDRAADWEIREAPFWTHVRGPVATAREQGWKLHVSATPLSAPTVLHRVARVLVERDCEFKFAAGTERVEELTSTRYDRAQAGKFITAYPRDDDHLRDLAEELHRATAGLPGPRILSDRAWCPESIVHLRYGAITGVPDLTNDGSWATRIRRPDGTLATDRRDPWFAPPQWAPPPVTGPPPASTTPRSVLLGGHYRVEEAIRHSARGGVYRAVDERDGTAVIVKQARPHIGAGLDGADARDVLRAEAVLLAELAPLTPEPLEVFESAGHVFLAEAAVPGGTLAEWIGQRFTQLGGTPGVLPAEALDVARRLTALVAEVHRRGLVLRDLTPTNVMVTPERELRLIDPELVTTPGRPVERYTTPGFAAPEVRAAPARGPAPERTADLFSLGCVLFHLVTGTPPVLAPDDPGPDRPPRPDRDRLAPLLRLAGPARVLAPAIHGLLHPEPDRRWSLERLAAYLACPPAVAAPPPPDTAPPDTALDDTALDDVLAEGIDHIVATLDGTGDRLWRSDAFGATTDACNVQYGAAGVLAVLTRAAGHLDRPGLREAVGTVARWIDGRRGDVPRLLPGLYFGRAGTAWALHDAGTCLHDDELVANALELGRSVPVTWPNPDVCHGAAGSGLAQLHLWRASGRAEFLERADRCADGLLAAARRHPDGAVTWPVPADFDSELAGIHHLGFAHGVAGVATFLLAVGEETGRADCLAAARAAGDTLVAAAERGTDGRGARWRADHRGPGPSEMNYHWCNGASGVATFLVRLAGHTGDALHRELAEQAATAVHDARWISPTAACHGLAGNGDFLLDMAGRSTGELAAAHRRRAADLAAHLLARPALVDGRRVLPDESGTGLTVGYGTGLAGALGFLLRLRHGGPRWFLPETT